MRVAGKVVLWAAVFASAAGVGAYIAAHTEPFPPTADPGASAHVRLVERTRSPVGSDDFGGFTHTVLGGGSRSAFDIPIPSTTADQMLRFKRSVSDGDRGYYRSDNDVTVSCVKGCAAGPL